MFIANVLQTLIDKLQYIHMSYSLAIKSNKLLILETTLDGSQGHYAE